MVFRHWGSGPGGWQDRAGIKPHADCDRNHSFLVIGACLVRAVTCLVLRSRGGTNRQREQIRWIMLVGGVTVALLIGGWAAHWWVAPIPVAFIPFQLVIAVDQDQDLMSP